MDLTKLLRYVPLFASGVVVFFGLILLGPATGLLWHIRTFDWWVKLNPSVFGPTVDWLVWAFGFLIVLYPSIVALVHRMATTDRAVIMTPVIFPLLSVMILTVSYSAGAAGLAGSGFLATYVLISRSRLLLRIDRGLALRAVLTVVFGLLSLVAAGGVVSVLIWQQNFFLAMVSGSNLAPADAWLHVLALDLEVFYLARPLLTGILFILAGVAFIALFRMPLHRIVVSLSRRRGGMLGSVQNSGRVFDREGETAVGKWFPYLILVASLILGVALGVYAYVVGGVSGVLGVDSWFYINNLNSMKTIEDAVPFLQSGVTSRALFFVLLFALKTATGLSSVSIVRLMPAILSSLLAVSTFILVREGTGRSSMAALAALLSVISAQTALGMSAGIINNWFALSIASLMFALTVRSIRLRSKVAAIGALAFSLILVGSYAFLWVVVLAEVALVLVASLLSFSGAHRGEWKLEVGVLGAVLSGSVLVPVALLVAAAQLLGFGAHGIDPSVWFTQAWGYLTHLQPQLVGTIWGVFEEALDFAGNRIDLPFLTLLSIVGLLDHGFQRRSFNRIVASMVLVPIALTVIISLTSAAPYMPMWLTWRGLYIVPFYLTGTLGVDSIIRRVNGSIAPIGSRSRLIFAGTFVTYIFLSHLSYSLRALELLIFVQ
jgi:hypothetical protein